MITAHSGADGTKENSLEFVKYAMQTGADALEVDVRMGENGILILSHDKTDEDAARLADVFRMMRERPQMRINCDLKEYGLEMAVRQLALISGLKIDQILYSGSVRPVPNSARGEMWKCSGTSKNIFRISIKKRRKIFFSSSRLTRSAEPAENTASTP